ncbi:Glyceraldehyde-3-phosphate dehydrogenase [Sulfitobacter noctilucae]|uniref:type I glyceraldehyde-3-phosphate dehydrogenase n=1 Tax=Sulfitobacter noctilucae TaxID=1342302 RepID=UPI0004683B39|nr:type I glyceraldehyde-3-phosphate dehydrogenase [Sulfitobacter noctilucae]KIN60786.1 Glyceraldehyde-3-phosphate dehydrogenase [Sulfitobacter noctilucae]
MTVTLAINGFGRIGRTVLRALMARESTQFQVVAINDPVPAKTLAHLFEFDSLHGRYRGPMRIEDQTLDVGAGPIRLTAASSPEELPWDDVDIVLECSGYFLTKDRAALHLAAGARRVLLSAPAAQGAIKTIVYGVNHDLITADDVLVSNASCTTNCLVPVVQVLQQAFGIQRGHMTTVHSYTGAQPLHDQAHTDLSRGRAAGLSMIPTTTGAAETLGLVLPDLAGCITGTAIRVPTPNVSCCDLVVELDRATDVNEVNEVMRKAASGPMRGVLDTTNRKLVSVDFAGDPASAIVATDQTSVQAGTQARVLAWYDNEWAFSNRMLDTAGVMARLL